MAAPTSQQLVFVLGMHRSGTSAVTHGLEVLGYDLGNRLMEPLSGVNERGFFEDQDIFELNEDLLQTLDGRSWHSLRGIAPEELERKELADLKSRAIKLLTEKIGSSAYYAVKDPRFPILLPFWQSVVESIGVRVGYLIVIRNPLSVVKSLEKRDSLDPFKCYYLWLQHTVTSVKYTDGANRLVIDYDLFLSDPETHLSKIAQQFGIEFDHDSEHVKTYLENFLDASLRHTQFEVADLSSKVSDIPAGAREAYSLLAEVSAGQEAVDSARVKQLIESLKTELSQADPMLVYADRIDTTCRLMHDEIFRLRIEADVQRNQLSELHRKVSTLEESSNRIIQQIALQEADLQSKIEYLGRVEEQKRVLESELVGITSSRSWRLTRPLREMRKIIT